VRYTPIRHVTHEMRAHETHAYEMHARKMHARKIYAREMHACHTLVGKKLAISLVAVQFGKVDVKGFPIK
jgi:hypothetical protein